MMRTIRLAMAFAMTLFPLSQSLADNQKTTVAQVSTTVDLSDDVDYIVTSDTPFTDDGVVNIQNTDHAVLILEGVKPSKATSLLASHVRINGQRAQNNQNCQVKLYNRGCIIMPYASTMKPLTVYSEPNFQGESVNDFGLENSGGFMNTLTDQKLNNRIRSFRLKRGYMVTFSTRARGRGYSRCFIAADSDLEVATLPVILDQTITSYRVFKWYDAGKPALANDTRSEAVSALNVGSCYSFGLGESRLPDAECVPHHIYEDWPSAAQCGSVSYSPHMKTNNEPGNSADDRPQTVKQILDNWENLMATGMRLCSPSSHDGSTAHLREFMDSIDARGWRCDILDLHCYWNEWNFYNSIRGWVDSYHRPVWISEWVWGSSWGNNGIFAVATGDNRDNPTQAQLQENKTVVERICNALNGYDYVERYFYWNSEANCSKLYYDGKLTPAGEMYAKLNSGVGYNGKYDFVPRTPPMRDPSDLTIVFDKNTRVATLRWHEYNGEYNRSISLERRLGDGHRWEVVSDVTMQEAEADYTYEDAEATNGCQYRVHVVDANGKDRYTRLVMAASDDLEPGDAVQVDGATKYLGGNILLNGDFDMAAALWLNGQGEPIGAPYFQVVPVGGLDGGAYLQAYGNGSVNTEQALKTVVDIKPQTDYYFSGAVCNYGGVFAQLNLSADGVATTSTAGSLSNATENWLTQFASFNSGDYAKAIIAFRSLAGTAQFDKLMLCQLFDTKEDALADAAEKQQMKADAFRDFNTSYPELNEGLPATLQEALQAYRNMPRLQQLIRDAASMQSECRLFDDEAVLSGALSAALSAKKPAEVNEAVELLANAIEGYLSSVRLNNVIKQPSFASSTGWTTKCGTYTGGDQRTNSRDGVTFWNAWWSGLSASEGQSKTMAVRQELTGLDHGLYYLECKATTEHYCLSDQHAFIDNGELRHESPKLTADYFDLPSVATADCWQTLTTLPVYVDDDGVLTIGFEGSKLGAVDNAWHRLGEPTSTGDKREGWWCATDFVLHFTPQYRLSVTPDQWGVTCLPYAVHPSPGLTFYEIAGITPDLQNLCLRQIEETVAGQAFIYRSSEAEAIFLEYGDAVKSATDAPGGLRGFFKTSARVPKDYYYLTDGRWEKVVGDRPTMTSYTGILRPQTDSRSQPLAVLDGWEGATMPIVGMTAEEMAASVAAPFVSHDGTPAYFTLDGRRLRSGELKSGVYVRVVNGHAHKTIIQ